MLNKKYKVGEKVLCVYCEILEYIDIIEKRMSMFNQALNNLSDSSYIKIYNNKTVYKINANEKIIHGKIIQTDLYPLFYNVLSNIINDDCNVLLHSAVLCYNNIGILVVGDFGHGKTSLCLEANKSKIITLSADQTLLELKNGCLKLKIGSKYMKIRDKEIIIMSEHNEHVEIKAIFNLIGLCDNGTIKFDLVENKYHKIKTLFKYFTWHSDVPLFTDNSILDIDRIKIKKWLTSVSIPLYNIRGDSNEIIKYVKESFR